MSSLVADILKRFKDDAESYRRKLIRRECAKRIDREAQFRQFIKESDERLASLEHMGCDELVEMMAADFRE